VSGLEAAVAVASEGSLPVAPHVWLVLLAAAFLASAAAVLAARSRLAVAAGASAAGIALAGAAVLVGSELVAVGLAVAAALAGFGAMALQEPLRRRPRLLAGAASGLAFAAITAAGAVSATGGARLARSAPITTGQLAAPLYLGGALVVDGAALVVLVLLVASRSATPAGDQR
jgi:hypothetical protein